MSIRAYPVKKTYHNDYICRKTILNDSFSLSWLIPEENKLLNYLDFYENLNHDCAGLTTIYVNDMENYLIELRPEERYKIKDLVDAVRADVKEYGESEDFQYIEYQCM